jgi:hypothetical protein
MFEHLEISPSDCVFYKGPDGSIMSCGYKIDSELLKHGHQIMSVSGKKDKGANVSDIFKNLAVPMGLLCSNDEQVKSLNASTLDSEVIPKSLFDKLVDLASAKADSEPKETKKKTRSRKSSSSSSKTRKQKK